MTAMQIISEAVFCDEIDRIVQNLAARRADVELELQKRKAAGRPISVVRKQLKSFERTMARLKEYRARFDIDPSIPPAKRKGRTRNG